MNPDASGSPNLPQVPEWLAVGIAFAAGMFLYPAVVALLAGLLMRIASPLPHTMTLCDVVVFLQIWIVPALVMFGIGLGAGVVFWRIPLRVGLAAGIGAAAMTVWGRLALPAFPAGAEVRLIGGGVLVMAAGFLGGVLARRWRGRKNETAQKTASPDREMLTPGDVEAEDSAQ